jgi:C-terminal processing protease CtpA/Prc
VERKVDSLDHTKKLITKFSYFFIIPFLALIILSACTKDEVAPGPVIPDDIKSVNNFIWENMDTYYLWRELMPTDLDPDAQPDPDSYFHKLKYSEDDRWSFITDNYDDLVNKLQGIGKTYGHEYQLFRKTGSKEVYGIVEYVIKDSPAKTAGIIRGDVFNRINGVLLDTLNYRELLFNNESYQIGFADLIDDEVVSNDREIFITPVVMQEDPILLDTVYLLEGRNIGYLVYNRFISSLNSELNTVFSRFKSDGVNELVLDLRYNPGGSVGTATLLASLIAPREFTSNEEIFVKYIWNDIIDEYWREEEGDESPNLLIRFMDAAQNINLDRLYVIVSGSSASASELIINGLKPYMNVTLIGDTTHGKYTASITMHDEEKSFNWAIQPIVLKTANINNETDYKDGMFPDHLVADGYFSQLGDIEEKRLAQAISLITGIPIGPVARMSDYEQLRLSIPMISAGIEDRRNKMELDADNVHIY